MIRRELLKLLALTPLAGLINKPAEQLQPPERCQNHCQPYCVCWKWDGGKWTVIEQ